MGKELNESFLSLVRVGLGKSRGAKLPDKDEFADLKALADEQGLSAIVLDGIDKCHADSTESTEQIPLQIKLEWIGEVLQNYEQRYVQYEKSIGTLAKWHNEHGFRMMILKGYASSLDWPKPNHRPCGDIDIWQFGEQKEADKVLANTNFTNGTNIKIDTSHHHHTVFEWEGFSVENHYDFINIHQSKTNAWLEGILKDLGRDDTHIINVCGEKVYLPSPNLHALFLMKHAALHFVSTDLTLRQVLDWAFFVEKHGKDVDWRWLKGVLEEHGMMSFFQIINAICVGDLGFDVSLFPNVQFDPFMKERVLNEIFASVYQNDEPNNIFKRQIHRYRRWKANEWKHKLCYKESMRSAFWSGVWGHLLKPSSI